MSVIGLRSADAAGFFGRAAEISEVDYLWRRHRLTVLFGPSGAGLTSLLHAGLVPRAVAPFVEVFPVGRIAQGSSFPVAALPEHNPHTLALLRAWSPVEPPTRLAYFTLVDFLRKRWRNSRPKIYPAARPTLLCVIDQAEELVTGLVSGGLFRAAFIEQLAEAIREIPELHVLFSVRRDYKGALVGGLAASMRCRCAVRDSPARAGGGAGGGARADGGDAQVFRSRGRGTDSCRPEKSGDHEGQQVAPPLLQGVCARLWRAVPTACARSRSLTCDGTAELVNCSLTTATR